MFLLRRGGGARRELLLVVVGCQARSLAAAASPPRPAAGSEQRRIDAASSHGNTSRRGGSSRQSSSNSEQNHRADGQYLLIINHTQQAHPPCTPSTPPPPLARIRKTARSSGRDARAPPSPALAAAGVPRSRDVTFTLSLPAARARGGGLEAEDARERNRVVDEGGVPRAARRRGGSTQRHQPKGARRRPDKRHFESRSTRGAGGWSALDTRQGAHSARWARRLSIGVAFVWDWEKKPSMASMAVLQGGRRRAAGRQLRRPPTRRLSPHLPHNTRGAAGAEGPPPRPAPAVGDLVDLVLLELLGLGELERVKGAARVANLPRALEGGMGDGGPG